MPLLTYQRSERAELTPGRMLSFGTIRVQEKENRTLATATAQDIL